MPSTTFPTTTTIPTYRRTQTVSSIAVTSSYTTTKTPIISTSTSTVTRTTPFTTSSTPNTVPSTPHTTTTTTSKSKNPSSTTTMFTSATHINGQSSAQTGSNDFQIVSVAAPVAIVVILAFVILAVICVVRRRRKKNDGIYNNDSPNNSNNLESVSNPAYTTEVSDNIFKTAKSVERTASSFSQDSGYAECKDVDTVDANNGEYNTINFTQSTPNIDPAYSHIPKQAQMVDNTYSHITSDQNDQTAASNYSHVDMKTRKANKDVNDTTYNMLHTRGINKPPVRLPVNNEESENEYNHANFSIGSSKQDDNDTEYSHLNSSKDGKTKAFPTQTNSYQNDVEYEEVVKNNNRPDLNDDNDRAYFVLEKNDVRAKQEPSSDNNAHDYFVLEIDDDYTKSNAEGADDSTPHDYFVLMKK